MHLDALDSVGPFLLQLHNLLCEIGDLRLQAMQPSLFHMHIHANRRKLT